jgi:hypothetical protein
MALCGILLCDLSHDVFLFDLPTEPYGITEKIREVKLVAGKYAVEEVKGIEDCLLNDEINFHKLKTTVMMNKTEPRRNLRPKEWKPMSKDEQRRQSI